MLGADMSLSPAQVAEADKWWNGLSDHEKCVHASEACAERGGEISDVLYAVQKPYKWCAEAWSDYLKSQG